MVVNIKYFILLLISTNLIKIVLIFSINKILSTGIDPMIKKEDRAEVKSLWSMYFGLHTCYIGRNNGSRKRNL